MIETTDNGSVLITTESSSNRICVIATDRTGASSTNICSDSYKLDKTAPKLQGLSNQTITMGRSVNLTTGVSASDLLSGLNGSYSYSPTSVNGNSVGSTTVTYRVKDFAGNETVGTRTITVSATDASCFTFESASGTITGYSNSCTKDVIIPNIINGVTVANIKSSAFSNKQLTSVVIPSSVKQIGDSAFAINKITSVTIPSGVTTIGNNAFDANLLKSVTIPSTVKTIGWSAFRNNQLTSVSLPYGLTTIEESTFERNQLTSISLPSSLTKIGRYAFQTNLLTGVSIPSTVKIVEVSAFNNNKLSWVSLSNGLTEIGQDAFSTNQISSVTIPSSVMILGEYAFRYNQLTSVRIVGKSSWRDFTTYGTSGGSFIWGWANGYTNDDITWNG